MLNDQAARGRCKTNATTRSLATSGALVFLAPEAGEMFQTSEQVVVLVEKF